MGHDPGPCVDASIAEGARRVTRDRASSWCRGPSRVSRTGSLSAWAQYYLDVTRAPHPPPPAAKPQPGRAPTWRTHARDLRTTLALVWATDPRRTALIATLSVLQAGVPAVTLWIGKLLLDAVALAITGGFASEGEAFARLATLLGVQVAVRGAGALFATLTTPPRSCWATRCSTPSRARSSTRRPTSTSNASRTPTRTTRCRTPTARWGGARWGSSPRWSGCCKR